MGHSLPPRPSRLSTVLESALEAFLLAGLDVVAAGPASRRATLSPSSAASIDGTLLSRPRASATCTRLPVELAASSQNAIVTHTSVSLPQDWQWEAVTGVKKGSSDSSSQHQGLPCSIRPKPPTFHTRPERVSYGQLSLAPSPEQK